jgi:hypothetical protein
MVLGILVAPDEFYRTSHDSHLETSVGEINYLVFAVSCGRLQILHIYLDPITHIRASLLKIEISC